MAPTLSKLASDKRTLAGAVAVGTLIWILKNRGIKRTQKSRQVIRSCIYVLRKKFYDSFAHLHITINVQLNHFQL